MGSVTSEIPQKARSSVEALLAQDFCPLEQGKIKIQITRNVLQTLVQDHDTDQGV